MIELYFLRHADAGDPMAWQGPDAARPLSGKGERQADRLGRFLSGIGFTTDAIITSPKLRAAQTAEGVARHLGVPVTIDDRLAESVDLRRSRTSCAPPAIRSARCSSATTPTSAIWSRR